MRPETTSVIHAATTISIPAEMTTTLRALEMEQTAHGEMTITLLVVPTAVRLVAMIAMPHAELTITRQLKEVLTGIRPEKTRRAVRIK
jgi:hypothetical protein